MLKYKIFFKNKKLGYSFCLITYQVFALGQWNIFEWCWLWFWNHNWKMNRMMYRMSAFQKSDILTKFRVWEKLEGVEKSCPRIWS